MEKKSEQDEFAVEFNEAHARIVATVRACNETLSLASIMAALGEALVEATDALMLTEQEMKGTTTTSLLAARDLLQLIARQIELRAAALVLVNPDVNNQVH